MPVHGDRPRRLRSMRPGSGSRPRPTRRGAPRSSSSRARAASNCWPRRACGPSTPTPADSARPSPPRSRTASTGSCSGSGRARRPTAARACCAPWARDSWMPRATRSRTAGAARRRGSGRTSLGSPPLPAGGVTVLSDVTNPLLGAPRGGRRVRPAEGRRPRSGRRTRRRSRAPCARCLDVDPPTPGAGAAGGTGFGLLAWGASLVPGSVAVADLIGLRAAVAAASVVVTGEGSFDGQSAAGKVPAHVAAAAGPTAVALVAGRIAPDADTSAFADRSRSPTSPVRRMPRCRTPRPGSARPAGASRATWADPRHPAADRPGLASVRRR